MSGLHLFSCAETGMWVSGSSIAKGHDKKALFCCVEEHEAGFRKEFRAYNCTAMEFDSD